MIKTKAPDFVPEIGSMDHSEFGSMPEYIAVQKALDELAHALTKRERDGQMPDGWTGRARWLEMVREMAAVLPVSDSCPSHDHVARDDPYWAASPYKVESDGAWLRCFYYCPTHDRVWTCGYSPQVNWDELP